MTESYWCIEIGIVCETKAVEMEPAAAPAQSQSSLTLPTASTSAAAITPSSASESPPSSTPSSISVSAPSSSTPSRVAPNVKPARKRNHIDPATVVLAPRAGRQQSTGRLGSLKRNTNAITASAGASASSNSASSSSFSSRYTSRPASASSSYPLDLNLDAKLSGPIQSLLHIAQQAPIDTLPRTSAARTSSGRFKHESGAAILTPKRKGPTAATSFSPPSARTLASRYTTTFAPPIPFQPGMHDTVPSVHLLTPAPASRQGQSSSIDRLEEMANETGEDKTRKEKTNGKGKKTAKSKKATSKEAAEKKERKRRKIVEEDEEIEMDVDQGQEHKVKLEKRETKHESSEEEEEDYPPMTLPLLKHGLPDAANLIDTLSIEPAPPPPRPSPAVLPAVSLSTGSPSRPPPSSSSRRVDVDLTDDSVMEDEPIKMSFDPATPFHRHVRADTFPEHSLARQLIVGMVTRIETRIEVERRKRKRKWAR